MLVLLSKASVELARPPLPALCIPTAQLLSFWSLVSRSWPPLLGGVTCFINRLAFPQLLRWVTPLVSTDKKTAYSLIYSSTSLENRVFIELLPQPSQNNFPQCWWLLSWLARSTGHEGLTEWASPQMVRQGDGGVWAAQPRGPRSRCAGSADWVRTHAAANHGTEGCPGHTQETSKH